ncbi:MAG: UDP-N-acetylglucosamine 2-epimerase (non-hydrolyzing) [Deltaproteobacteria bacterium]|nr:UDP-N-acetylglucosamine 2-epimerase (non-hydrolyzing) [Deltaproteobacteria bacterium]
MSVKILCIAGARPNFMKIAPLLRAFSSEPFFEPRLLHTGQHYDDKLSRIFFEDLRIPRPDVELEVGSGSHAAQTAEIMRRFEPVLRDEQPHAVLVVGDVNSTIACALVTAKFQLESPFAWKQGTRRRPVIIHVEAGLRSFDDDMPEEVNRKLTDAISDVLFVSDPAGIAHLRREGVPSDRVFFVGNVMIDTLLSARDRAMQSQVLVELGLAGRAHGLVTLHRPSNVDDPSALREILTTLDSLACELPLVFPIHPRTRGRLQGLGFTLDPHRWILTDPVGYLDFLKLMATARVVLTDSGGVQEETTVLGVPCVTLRENTERPVTMEEGTNILAGTQPSRIREAFTQAMTAPRTGRVPQYWDGQAAVRVRDILLGLFRS